ncbi:hypothetical protein [Modestobacter sp. DSM 44400]|uniref:hypothetical protein n=1 Tax=Modestobacter sp. DSM 44400 TaxID=1550230 RepID=UPI001115441F|nr:hypothetical protein [Modestobacter sp. DSM 44400]
MTDRRVLTGWFVACLAVWVALLGMVLTREGLAEGRRPGPALAGRAPHRRGDHPARRCQRHRRRRRGGGRSRRGGAFLGRVTSS